MPGIVNRDVLVDGRLAERHEEAEHEHQHGERHHAHGQREFDRPVDSAHDVGGRRIGQQERAHDRHAERQVHDRAGPDPVGQPAADDAKQARRDRVHRRDQAGRADVETVGADQVARQPQRQRDERAEHEEVVERKAPDLQVPQRLELLEERLGLRAAGTPLRVARIVLGQQEVHDRRGREHAGPDLRDRVPAPCHHDQRRRQLGHRGADVARAEDAERGALFFPRKPLGDVGDADCERPAGDAHQQCCEQVATVGRHRRQEPGCGGGAEHDPGEHDAAADLVGPDAERQPAQRAGQDGRGDQQAELRVVELQLLLDLQADDRKDRPDCEADRERERAAPQRNLLVAAPDGAFVHDRVPRERSTWVASRRGSARARQLVQAAHRIALLE